MGSDLQALTGTLGSLALGLLLPGKVRSGGSQLLNGMHHALLQEVLAEDGRQLVHQNLCQLQSLGHGGSVLLGEQTGDETGDGQVSQLLTQCCRVAEVKDLGDGGKALGAHLHAVAALISFWYTA